MHSFQRKHSVDGFTLIELLIVIVVISILVVALITQHSQSLRQAKVQVAAETLGAFINEQRILVRSGTRETTSPVCYGIRFGVDDFDQNDETLEELRFVRPSYSSEECQVSEDGVIAPFTMPAGVGVSKLLIRYVDASGSLNEIAATRLVVVFSPPDGIISFWVYPDQSSTVQNISGIADQSVGSIAEADIFVSFIGETDVNSPFMKVITVNGLSGAVTVE